MREEQKDIKMEWNGRKNKQERAERTDRQKKGCTDEIETKEGRYR